MKPILAAAALTILAACGSEPPARFETPAVAATEKVRISYGSVAVREVSLPSYASTDEIATQDAEGRLTSTSDTLWADDPVRAVTLGLARVLKDMTGARVAPDPWPFLSRPDVSVDVRFEEFIPTPSGYMARGLYFVAPDEEGRREHAHDFEFTVPLTAEGGVGELAQARSTILSLLALDIAKTALR